MHISKWLFTAFCGIAGRWKGCAMMGLLTPRERSVFDQLVRRYAKKGAAIELDISLRTMEIHPASIARKLQAESLADMTRIYLIAIHRLH